jgi:hypothetical protein
MHYPVPHTNCLSFRTSFQYSLTLIFFFAFVEVILQVFKASRKQQGVEGWMQRAQEVM